MSEDFKLSPADQCTTTDRGHFGDMMKEAYQGASGVLAREQTWTRDQWSDLKSYLDHRSDRDGGKDRQDPGPYNHTFLDMAIGGDLYTLGQDTRTLTMNGKPVETGSTQYNDALTKIETAAAKIDLNAPLCPGLVKGLYEDMEQKK